MGVYEKVWLPDPHLSVVTLCEAEIDIGGRVRLLRPTLRGVLTICNAGGFDRVTQGLRDEDVDAMTAAVMAGLCYKIKKRSKVEQWIWDRGLNDDLLILNLLDFLSNLARGGKLEDKKPESSVEVEDDYTPTDVTYEEWVDTLYKTGTGWLGWPPEIVMTTTIGALQLAIEGKIDFVRKTNPWGSDEDNPDEKAKKLLQEKPNPELAAKQLQAFFGRMLTQQQVQQANKK